jgi:hypothetical protein
MSPPLFQLIEEIASHATNFGRMRPAANLNLALVAWSC